MTGTPPSHGDGGDARSIPPTESAESSERDGTTYSATAVTGATWQGFANIGVRVLRAAVFFVLARILLPDAFGVVSLAMVFVSVLQYFSGAGLSSAIVYIERLSRSHLDTAFWLGLVSGLVLSVGLAFIAFPIAELVGQAELGGVLLGLAVLPLLSGLTMVPEGLLSRELRFRALSIRHLIAATTSVAVAIILALSGAGVWALVAQAVGEAIISAIALWISLIGRYTVGSSIDGRSLSDLLSFSLKIVGQNLTQVASNRGDDLLIGIFLGPIALGLYSVAYRLLTILQESLLNVASNVAFPMYSRLRLDPVRLSLGFHRACRLVFSIAAPVYLFLGIASTQVIAVALGEQWLPSAPVMTVLAVSGIVTTVIEVNNVFVQSVGYPGRVLSLSVAGAVLNLVGFAIAVNFGIFWVAVALAVRCIILLPFSIWMAGISAGGPASLVRSHVPIVVSLVVPAGGGIICQMVSTQLGPLAALAIAVPLSAVAYIAMLRLVAKSVYLDLAAICVRLLPKGWSLGRQYPKESS